MKGPIQIDAASWRMTIIALGNASVSMETAARVAVITGGAILLNEVRRNVSRTDYTLDQLAKLNHPYGKLRWPGGINTGALGGEFAKRPYLVHVRSGAFRSSIRGRPTTGQIGYEVYAADTAPWVKYVILGTRVMHARDVIWQTAHDPAVKRKMTMAVIRVLGDGLRLQAAVRTRAV